MAATNRERPTLYALKKRANFQIGWALGSDLEGLSTAFIH